MKLNGTHFSVYKDIHKDLYDSEKSNKSFEMGAKQGFKLSSSSEQDPIVYFIDIKFVFLNQRFSSPFL